MASQNPTTSSQLPFVFEEWRPVLDWEETYEVSNLGRVRSVEHWTPVQRKRWGVLSVFHRHVLPTLLIQKLDRKAQYFEVCIQYKGKRRYVRVHHLVLEAFVGRRPPGYQGNHLNGDKLDNRPENLEWTTPLGNTTHAIETGLRSRRQGEENNKARFTTAQVQQMRRYHADGLSLRTIAGLFRAPLATVQNIIARKTWKHVP